MCFDSKSTGENATNMERSKLDQELLEQQKQDEAMMIKPDQLKSLMEQRGPEMVKRIKVDYGNVDGLCSQLGVSPVEGLFIYLFIYLFACSFTSTNLRRRRKHL